MRILRSLSCENISARFLRSVSFLTLVSLAALIVLSGCGSGTMGNQAPTPLALHGKVHGGQQAVSSSTIQLYAAGSAVGSAGYGSAATPLLTTTVTTDPNGDFNITSDYTCPTPTTEVYIVATGGNPGLGAGTNNTALAMMAALGECGNLTPSTLIFIDEVTTVASVYALAPFMKPGGGANLGASTTNSQGLANAFATVNNLVDTTKGTASGPTLPAGATVPIAELNTLADMIAPCVNSNGSTGECASLFSAATPSGGSAPTNTIDAVLDIALNPANNVSGLYNLVTGTAPFQPILPPTPTPNDWTVAVNYTGAGLSTPYFLAVDAGGNVWVSNQGNSSVSKLSPTGSAISGASGYTAGGVGGPWGVAVDPSGNVWVADDNSNALTELSSTGTAVGASPFVVGGISAPYGIAINGSGTVWTANGASVSAVLNNGTAQLNSPYTGGGLTDCYTIAIDNSGNIWVTNFSVSTVSELTSTGGAISSGSGYADGGLNGPWGIAIDSAGNAWVADNGTSRVSELNMFGGTTAPSGFNGGGLSSPQGIAVDGAGSVWVANNGNNSVTELNNSGTAISPSTGYLGGAMNGPVTLAVDGSGNVWVSNGAASSVTELVGVASPVVTPLSVAAKNSLLGQRP